MSGAKIIKPTVITDAMLASCSVAEPDVGEVLWSAGPAYAVGDVRIRTTTHRKYARRTAGTSAAFPEDDPTNWRDIGPTNQRALFDRKVGTLTTAPTSMTYVLRPGPISGLGMLEVSGRVAVVTMKDGPGGTVVYERTVDLDGTVVDSVYDWFFGDYEQLTNFVLTDLPQHYGDPELTVQVTSTTDVAVGVLQVGKVIEVGDTQYGATVGITDFSKKDVDEWGNRDVIEGAYSNRNSLQIMTKKSDFMRIFRVLVALRATPCIYIGVDEAGFEPMIIYGFYKNFSIVVSYATHHLCNLETEGL
ncbi:MAG: hypothetical protein ACXW2U_08940 [Telluria sp.]